MSVQLGGSVAGYGWAGVTTRHRVRLQRGGQGGLVAWYGWAGVPVCHSVHLQRGGQGKCQSAAW